MDKRHIDKLEKYRGHLIEHTQFDALWETLTSDGQDNIFPEYMVEDILSTPNGSERNERFYNLIESCDYPGGAFATLCNALSLSGQNELSRLLLDDKLASTAVDVSRSRHVIPPLLHRVTLSRKPRLSSWGSVRMRDPNYAYYVQSSPRGYLLLVNMRFVMHSQEDERRGSEVDVTNLRDLFTQLDFKIVEHHNLTLAEMERAVLSFSQMEELSTVDSVAVFVMSHGRDPAERTPCDPPLKSPGSESVDIVLEDNRLLNSNDIVQSINSSPTIRPNTPKLFFFNVCRGEKVNKGSGYLSPVSVDSSGGAAAEANTSTEVDTMPWANPIYYDQTEPSNENNVASNGIHSNENNVASNGIHSYENNVASNGIHSNGNNNLSLNLTKDPNDNLSPESTASTTLCCCFPHPNRDRRKNLCVRVAIWLSAKLKCSMPSMQDEAVSSYPGGGPCETKPPDSPDSELPHDLWRPENTEAGGGIVRTSSKASSGHSHAGSIKQMFEKITHKMFPEPRHQPSDNGDIFMAFSTVDGYNSKRHPTRGTWFVTLLCQVFAESATDTDLVTMMEDVDRRLRAMSDPRYGTQMHVNKKLGFSKKFYFNVEAESD